MGFIGGIWQLVGRRTGVIGGDTAWFRWAERA